MEDISFDGTVVEICGERVQLPAEILNVIVEDGVVVVLCGRGEMDPQNVVAFDMEGKELWRAPACRGSDDDVSGPVERIFEKDGSVRGVTVPDGTLFELDLETGTLDEIGWAR